MMTNEQYPKKDRIIYKIIATLLLLHYIFVLTIANNISGLSVICFIVSVLLFIAPTRHYFANWCNNRHWLQASVFFTLSISANILLEINNKMLVVHHNLAFINANIIDGHKNRKILENSTLLVNEKGHITAIGTPETVVIPAEYKTIDVKGQYLLPGLVNAHAHLLYEGANFEDKVKIPEYMPPDWLWDLWQNNAGTVLNFYVFKRLVIAKMEKQALSALRAGVTTLRSLGDLSYTSVTLRKKISSGEIMGPRIIAAGPMLSVTGGHGSGAGVVFDGPTEARKAVRILVRNEVDAIKISNTGGILDSKRLGEAGQIQMTVEEIEAVTDEAHRKGLLVAAHAESTQGVKEALLGGVDSIEHGSKMTDEIIALFKNNPKSLRGYTSYHPTLSITPREWPYTEQIKNNPRLNIIYHNNEEVRADIINGFKQSIEEGVYIAVGTDSGAGLKNNLVWRELYLFTQHADISNKEAIYMGTLATAKSIGIAHETGSIDVGKSADFMIVNENPYINLSSMAKPSMVVMKGVIVN